MNFERIVAVGVFLSALLAASVGIPDRAQAQIKIEKGFELFGSPSNCSRPATVDYEKLLKETDEYKKIQSKGIRKGSARYRQLMTNADIKIKKVVKAVAQEKGHDLVFRKGKLNANPNNLTITNIHDNVMRALKEEQNKGIYDRYYFIDTPEEEEQRYYYDDDY